MGQPMYNDNTIKYLEGGRETADRQANGHTDTDTHTDRQKDIQIRMNWCLQNDKRMK